MSDEEADLSFVESILDIDGLQVELGGPFGSKTTYRVGGTCLVHVTCTSDDSLKHLLRLIASRPMYVLGNGSNTLVNDVRWPGVVVSLAGEFGSVLVEDDVASLGAGVALPIAARQLASRSLGGMEWAVGIPGTVGGAVRMNAGGHGSETSQRLISAHVLRYRDGTYVMEQTSASDLGLSYRSSNLGERDVVLSGNFQLCHGDATESKKLISQIVAWRRDNQPGGQNAGSVFANPQDDHAARIIESMGLKGYRYGSAQVSERHANFIQCDPGGHGNDVFNLIWIIQQKVEKEFGVRLRTEIRLVGFDAEQSSYLRGE